MHSSSTLLTIFGGKIVDLEPFPMEEHLLEGWESHVQLHMGLTFLAFNRMVVGDQGGRCAYDGPGEPLTV